MIRRAGQVRLEDEVERIAVVASRLNAALSYLLDRDRGGVPVGGVLAADQIDQPVADGQRHPALEPDGEIIETLSRSRREGACLRQGDGHPVLEQVVPPRRRGAGGR